MALHEFSRLGLGSIFSPSLVHWIDTIYALAFVQNTMTTGMIAYRIWQQDRRSQGLVSSSLSLIVLIRIIVESALIYVLNVLILIVLYALNSNGQFVAEEAIVPVCGIVFTLITVRLSLHASTTVSTTVHPGTQIIFAGFPIATTDTTAGFTTTTTDQSTLADSAKRAVRIDRHAFVSDDWDRTGEPDDNGSDSKDDIPLEDVLRDEKVNTDHDIRPGTAA
ncbi:hypothetical protein PILCRDRAFT_821291 [Piloderma croceum F 1598]|uniref:Uncharacterized protein n=1 Tax=Piloderma croceum (strain F 1598) TaxID=765440 RepID=A0A0C3BVV0_PILCF|nr:hypothetical protein PILCRDRAFT_821291 [Piloderma croceum F 1598]